MATNYLSFMFAYSEAELSAVLPLTYDSLDNDGGVLELMSRKMDEDTVLQSISSKNWLFYMIKNIYEANKFECLQFLTNDWAVLNPVQVQEIAHGFEIMFKMFRDEPQIILNALGRGYSLDEIIEAIKIAKPTFNPNTGGDGDDILYLMIYLISVKSLLQDAAKQGFYIMYLLPQRMSEADN